MKNRKLFTNFGWYKSICFGLIVLGCLVFPVAAADKLYSVDPVLDKLVIIDSGSLAISEIGPLGVNINGIDGMVPLGGNELLAILVTSTGSPYGHYELYKINALSGQATWIADIIDGDDILDKNLAESLARNPLNGYIYISYSSGAYSSSDLLGKVNPATGAISPVCSVGRDMDAIEFSPTGSLVYAFDVNPLDSTSYTQYFYSVNPVTCAATTIKEYTIDQFIIDMEFLSNGNLVGVEKSRRDPRVQQLVEINPATGDYSSLGQLNGYTIDSLCLKTSIDPSPAPEFPSAFLPATMIIGFLGAVLLIQRTREH